MKKITKEIWKPIEGHPFYKVSNLGRVKSINRTIKKKNGIKQRRKGVMLKPSLNPVTGYLSVDLNGMRYYVHRLVIGAFVENPNPEVLTDVNHINRDKQDCRLCNLEYLTHAQNIQHRNRTNLDLRNKKAN